MARKIAAEGLSLDKQREIVMTWKWRWLRLGTNATKVAAALGVHQGNLCDYANLKTNPVARNFNKIEDWTLKQERKKKII